MRINRDRKKHQTQNELRIPLGLTYRTPAEEQDNSQKQMGKIRKMTISGNTKRKFRNPFSITQRRDKAKEEKEFRFIIDDIQKRGGAFVRLAFTSDEKKGNKKLLGDVFHLRAKDLKGSMTITELWSNKDRTYFLKENKIKMNKMKFIEKLATLKREKFLASKKINSIESIKTIKPQPNSKISSNRSISSLKLSKKKSAEQHALTTRNIAAITDDIGKLEKEDPLKQLRTKIKTLEDYQSKMEQMQKKYFFDLIQML